MKFALFSQEIPCHRIPSWVQVLPIIFSLALLTQAQNAISGGAISGVVTDATGAVVAGVSIHLTNDTTGVRQSTQTNTTGLYSFPFVLVGTYDLTFERAGFQKTAVNHVIVQVGQTTSQNVQLSVGSMQDSVTVTAAVPLLRPTESSISTVVNQKLINDLPLSGRRYTDFVLLTPNVNADGQFGLVSIGGQQGGADSGYANGNGSNSFTVDGANDTSNYFGDARGRTRVPYVFGEQAIQEFQVADTPYSAAYGGAGSGFVNTVTKSGTDTFHGNAFYFNRNSGTGANDAVDHANHVPRPLNVLQQFGADFGGPVVAHKAWFYFDYEQQRQLNPISVINSKYAAVSETDFNNVAPGTPLPSPSGSFPLPTSFSASGAPAPGSPNYPAYLQGVSNALNTIHSNLGQRARRRDDLSFFPKLDWQPEERDHFTFDYNYNRFNSPGGTITFNPVASDAVESLPNNYVRDHHATAHWTHTFSPVLLNDFHASFLRDEQIGTPSGLINPSFPNVYLFARGFFDLGNPVYAISDTKEFQWVFGEQLTYVRGRHTLKFGTDINRTHVSDFFPGNFQGTYEFFDLTSFALGAYGLYTQAGGNPHFPFTYPYYAFYAQDKFQVRHNLTLDYGLREDFQVYPQPRENPAFPLTGQFPNRYRRLSPRFGFAYQPRDKTVIRGGFGLFYEVFNGINYENSTVANGLVSQQGTTALSFGSAGAPTFPGNLGSTALFQGSSNISLVSPNFKTPMIMSSSLEIQQELTSNTTLTLGTLWTHGTHLIASSAYDLNLLPPSGVTTYVACPPGTFSVASPCNGPVIARPTLDAGLLTDGLISSNFGQINALISPGVNQYNSFYANLQRRVAQGLSVMTSYTFSKGMQTGVDFYNQFDLRDTHGPTLLDQRHRLSIAAVYSPDATHFSGQATRRLLSNWTISSVMGFNSGRPYTGLLNASCTGVNFSSCSSLSNTNNNLNDSAFNESTGNTAAGINAAGPSPTLNLNSFYGPWIDEVDLGIARVFRLGERQAITLQAQVFNLLNHPNYYVQNGSGIFSTQYDPLGPNCGSATPTQTCYLVPDPGFKTLQSVSQLNPPRVFQFAFYYRF
ncbi:MAG: TonB-dependent receptor [Acidobacteria bacterium]|nr:TonB-dependent receptor [Acidobacteriota bacterium]